MHSDRTRQHIEEPLNPALPGAGRDQPSGAELKARMPDSGKATEPFLTGPDDVPDATADVDRKGRCSELRFDEDVLGGLTPLEWKLELFESACERIAAVRSESHGDSWGDRGVVAAWGDGDLVRG